MDSSSKFLREDNDFSVSLQDTQVPVDSVQPMVGSDADAFTHQASFSYFSSFSQNSQETNGISNQREGFQRHSESKDSRDFDLSVQSKEDKGLIFAPSSIAKENASPEDNKESHNVILKPRTEKCSETTSLFIESSSNDAHCADRTEISRSPPHISEIPPYQCCSRGFSEKEVFCEHVKNDHEAIEDIQGNVAPESLQNVADDSDTEESSGESELICHPPKEVFDEKTLKRLMLLNKCNTCDEEFKLRSHLLDHVRGFHNGEGEEEAKNRAMTCLFCSKNYFNEYRLLKHELCHPDKSESIKCLKCGEVFQNSTALKHHKQRQMESVSCPTCLKKFPNDNCLTNHISHQHSTTGEPIMHDANINETDETEKDDISSGTSTPLGKHRKFRCRFCPKKCSHRKSLVKHEMSHPDGSASIKCSLCLEVLESYKEFKIHKKQEDCEVICSICSMWFPNGRCLSNHTRNSHSTFDDDLEDIPDSAEDSANLNSNQCHDEDENYSSEGSSVYLDALPRYTISDSVEPLRITIKQKKEDDFLYSPHSFTSSSATPPTPRTPSPQGPPTPSPPPFSSFVEESSEEIEEEEESSDEDESYFASRGRKSNSSSSRRKSSLRTPRKVLPSDVYFESSGEESGNDDPEDFLYMPKAWKESEEDDESDDDPVSRKTRNSFSYSKKRGGVVDEESDDDPDWRKTRNSVNIPKKRATRGRGRGRKKSGEDFPILVQPKVKRPRARGCGGQKAQDAASALADAVEEMESSMPELKVVIRPLKRSLGGSITKASVKRYSEVLASDRDYLVDVKLESNQEDTKKVQNTALPEVKPATTGTDDNATTIKDVYSFEDEDDSKDEAEDVVIKLEPREIVGDDFSKCNDSPPMDTSGDHSYDFEDGTSQDFNAASVGEDIKEIRYVCKFCGRELQYRSHLLRHLRRVHGGEGVDEVMRRLMKCRFCSKQYSNELSLIHHEKLHDGTNKIKCNKCEEVFEDKNALRRHQRKTHWEHQPVECEVCKKQLADNTCLKAHMKHMHTAEERKVTVFTCETCGRQLHTKTAFQNHVASKCGTNLLFPCDTCGKSFSFKGSLKAHQLLHTGVKSFLCRFCGKSFHQKGEMKRHERKHTGEKPFVCNVCGRAFAYRESLLGHSAVHTGIKPFPCKTCGMRFSCSGNLVKHRRSNNCRGPRDTNDASPPTTGTVKVNSSSASTIMGAQTVPAVETTAGMESQIAASAGVPGMDPSCDLQIMPFAGAARMNASGSLAPGIDSQTMMAGGISRMNSSSAQNMESSVITCGGSARYSMEPQAFMTPETARVNTSSAQGENVSQSYACPLPLRSSHNEDAGRKLCTVIQSSSQEKRGTSEMKSPLPTLPLSSVIKTNPVIAQKPAPVPPSIFMNVNLKTEPQDEVNQSYGMNIGTNRSAAQFSAMYETQDSNNSSLHNTYTASSLSTNYSDNQYRPLNHNSFSERHFSQFASDARIARNDSLFDREAIMRQEMNRHVMERSVDRQASRLLDCFSGVQFGGIDHRNAIQSFTAASAVGHPAAYSNIHPSHFSNYTAAHTSSSSNSHASLYGGNAMMPGQVSFANFPGSGHMGMAQNNQVPAHSVSHPATHMGHLGAFLGHFGHSPVHPSSSFPRYALSHNLGQHSPNPSFPSNHRM